MNQMDPPLQPNEEGWFDRYHKHLRKWAAGEVGPIKMIPKISNTPIGPTGAIPPLDNKLLVTSKVLLFESVPAADANTILFK